MSNFYTGAGTGAYINTVAGFSSGGWESVPSVVPVVQLNYTSETLNGAVTKSDEGSLLASKTAGAKDLTSINVSGSISYILRPENVNELFKLTLGEENGGVFTLQDPNVSGIPTTSIYLDRKYAKYHYTRCAARSLSLECVAGDYVKGSVELIGRDEVLVTEANQATNWPADISLLSKKSFKCTGASFKWAGTDVSTGIKSVTVNIDNGFEETPKTYSSGVYNAEPALGQRVVTFDVALTGPAFGELKEQYAKGEALAGIELNFSAPDGSTVKIEAPNVSVTEASGNVSGTGIIDMTLKGEALSIGTDEPLTITVVLAE